MFSSIFKSCCNTSFVFITSITKRPRLFTIFSSGRHRLASGFVCRSNNEKITRRHVSIYTKTGDKGGSMLFSGERRKKSDMRFQALGTIDELSSSLGMSIAFAEESKHSITDSLVKIQCILQDIGSFVATPLSSAREAHTSKLHFNPKEVEELEKAIDYMSSQLPALTNFILPSGGKTSSSLHLARAVCRRAERHLADLLLEEELNEDVFRYINRLSDYLFMLARYSAMQEGREEHIYRPH
ncbi:corrinoid adenosyltransferase MMAB-like [Watersipora subatra]|uniref:corrinoid adenosyltransferase MMAB-like n=1 Tax=Watersipora subatra TaxID=2589382 RepID=UPI00355B74D9